MSDDLYIETVYKSPTHHEVTVAICGDDDALWELWDLIWQADDAGLWPVEAYFDEPFAGELWMTVFWADETLALDFLTELWENEPVEEVLPLDAYLAEISRETWWTRLLSNLAYIGNMPQFGWRSV